MKIGFGQVSIGDIKIDDSFKIEAIPLARMNDNLKTNLKLISKKHKISIGIIIETEPEEKLPKLVTWNIENDKNEIPFMKNLKTHDTLSVKGVAE